MDISANDYRVEQFYKEDEQYTYRRAEKKPYYWYKGIRMSATAVCDLLNVNVGSFLKLAKIHGNQTANMIERGELPIKELTKKKAAREVNFTEIGRQCGVAPSTIRMRYLKGQRGEELTRPCTRREDRRTYK